jgi:TPR repeat protein
VGLPFVEAAATKGDPKAMRRLGMCYRFGKGVEQRQETAIQLLARAAERADPKAMVELAFCLENGIGMDRDAMRAQALYAAAADSGNPTGMNGFARLLLVGAGGVVGTPTMARAWFERAADLGHVEAQFNLGQFYLEGRDGHPDLGRAAHYFKMAVDQEFVPAQIELAKLLWAGVGVEQNRDAAQLLLKAASAIDPDGVVRAREELAEMD